jgi:hypothetical protein
MADTIYQVLSSTFDIFKYEEADVIVIIYLMIL